MITREGSHQQKWSPGKVISRAGFQRLHCVSISCKINKGNSKPKTETSFYLKFRREFLIVYVFQITGPAGRGVEVKRGDTWWGGASQGASAIVSCYHSTSEKGVISFYQETQSQGKH